jgi:hypothetical protein
MNTRFRCTPSLVVALVAVVLAATGSATAAGLFTGKNIKNSSLTGLDVKNSSLTGSDVKNGSLGTSDLSAAARTALKGATGATGQPGAKGDKGDPGVQGPIGPSNVFEAKRASAGAFADNSIQTIATLNGVPAGSYLVSVKLGAFLSSAGSPATGVCSLVAGASGTMDTQDLFIGSEGGTHAVALAGTRTLTDASSFQVRCQVNTNAVNWNTGDIKIEAIQVGSVTSATVTS